MSVFKTPAQKTFLSVLLSLAAFSAHAGLFGPSSYEDCVLEKLTEAKTEYAAALLKAVCSEKT